MHQNVSNCNRYYGLQLLKLFRVKISVKISSGSPCAYDPCLNGGACEKDGKNFTCTCLPGYRGKRCEETGKNVSYN